MNTKQLYNREDARRLAQTLVNIRRSQGETINVSTRRMSALPANVLASYASRPATMRNGFVLAGVSNGCITLRRTTR